MINVGTFVALFVSESPLSIIVKVACGEDRYNHNYMMEINE